MNDNCVFKSVKQFYLTNKKQFKIAHINVNSIRYKIEPFKEVLNESIFDVLTIQETKIDESFPDNQFHVPMYRLYRQDFKHNEGGIMMYIRNDFPQYRRSDIERFSINNNDGRIEILAVEVSINKEKWIFISIYKQPKVKMNTIVTCIDNIMLELSHTDFNIVLLGDFNVNMFNQNNPFKDCIDGNGLRNLVKTFTCEKGKPTLIDLILTNKPKRFINTISVDTGLSDFHNLICTSTKFDVPQKKSTTFQYRSYKHFNLDSFQHDLSMVPYHVTDIFDDIDDSYWLWNELTMQIVNSHAPIKYKTIKGKRVPYMNGELRKAINVRNMLKRKFDKYKNTENWIKYRNHRNLVTRLRKKSMNNYLHNKCSNTTGRNGKEFWDIMKPLISNKCINKNDNLIIETNGIIVTQPDDVAASFNDYFINMAKDIGPDDSLKYDDDVMSCLIQHEDHDSIVFIKEQMDSKDLVFNFHNVSTDTIKKHLQKLNCKKATGYDLLPCKLLKLGSDILCHSLCNLINMSVNLCKFPNVLKKAEICPIYKKGNNLDVSNYRPVSILPGISKVFERVMVNQLSKYFNDIFSPVLSGFRKQHSCETVSLAYD